MKTTTARQHLLTSTVLVGVAMAFSGAALAQTAPTSGGSPAASAPTTANGAPAAVSEFVVTGSRIPQPNLTSISPLTSVSAADVKLQGTTNVESLLNNLPQAFASQTSQVSNGSDGTAQANLRNLGANRTLVLIDGKRLMPGSPGAVTADLNVIPSGLVDRVEVVTGGASAVYGSDAVAGVVNFLLKKNFEGVQIDYQYSFDNHQNGNKEAQATLAKGPNGNGVPIPVPGNVGLDGSIHNVSVILGASSPDQKGNITAYATYRHTDPILQGTRDFSTCGFGSVPSNVNNSHLCIGSSNSAYGRFGGKANNPDGTKTFIRYNQSLAFNFNPLNFLQREDQNYSAGYFAHYEINPRVEVYSDFLFSDDQTNAQIAPSGLFRNSGPNLASSYTFNCNNPLLGPTQAATLCPGSVINPGAPGGDLTHVSIGYRFAGVPRNSNFRHDEFKVDVGFRGDLGAGWHYDGYLQYGTSIVSTLITGYGSESRIQNALNVVNDANGNPVCVIGGSCVPLDIFVALSKNITPAAFAYVLQPALTQGRVTQQVASFNVTGDLGQYGLKSPYASEGVGVSIGAEYRRDFLSQNFDAAQHNADLSGGGGQALDVAGATDVKEIFGEIRAPLVTDMPFVKNLTFDGGYRFSHYSSAGNTNTYKFGLEYSPTDDVRFRGSYNRAVRAPNVQELFAPQVVGLAGGQDPCAVDVPPGIPPGVTAAQCLNTGLPIAQFGTVSNCPSSQCSGKFGGSTLLKPETADTYSVGVVFTPTFFRGFSASIDYFNIKVTGVISAGFDSFNNILNSCLASAASFDCSLIHRDPVTGGLNTSTGFVDQLSANAGAKRTSGVDFAANYRFDIDQYLHDTHFGALNLSFVGTYTRNLIAQPVAGGPSYDCAGYFGNTCGTQFASAGVTPKFKSQTRITWTSPWNLQVSLNWRYISGVTLDALSPNPALGAPQPFADSIDGHIGAYSYFDLAANYKVRDGLVIRAGINNLFDKDPPAVDANNLPVSAPPFGNGNTFPGVYDSLGRNIFVGLTANF